MARGSQTSCFRKADRRRTCTLTNCFEQLSRWVDDGERNLRPNGEKVVDVSEPRGCRILLQQEEVPQSSVDGYHAYKELRNRS